MIPIPVYLKTMIARFIVNASRLDTLAERAATLLATAKPTAIASRTNLRGGVLIFQTRLKTGEKQPPCVFKKNY